MKKQKCIWWVIVSIFLLSYIFPTNISYAEEHVLKEYHILVELHKDGSAKIYEVQRANLSEGTEMFDVIGNLGESTIKDFTVSEDGKEYQFVEDWDIDASREE